MIVVVVVVVDVAVPTTTITSIVGHIMPRAHASISCTIRYPPSKFAMCGRDGIPVITNYLPRLSKVVWI